MRDIAADFGGTTNICTFSYAIRSGRKIGVALRRPFDPLRTSSFQSAFSTRTMSTVGTKLKFAAHYGYVGLPPHCRPPTLRVGSPVAEMTTPDRGDSRMPPHAVRQSGEIRRVDPSPEPDS